MKKTMIITALLLTAMVSSLFAQDLDVLLEKFNENQKKIETFIGRGSSTTKIMGSSGDVIKTIKTTMSIFLKRPNKLKLITDQPVQTTFVQQGDYVTQKIAGQGGAVTTKADERTNFLQFYFGQDIPGYQSGDQVIESETVVIDGKTLYRFKIAVDAEDDDMPEGINLDFVETYFNTDGMVEKTVLYDNNKAVITSKTVYIEKEGIFLPLTLTSTTQTGGTTMESVIHYTSVNVNIEILDKEFYIF